jgi:hypothetical protein
MVPLSIGVEVYGGHVEYCLMRGAWLPTERSRVLTIKQFEFLESSRIVAGERHTNAASNIVLGKWDVPSSRWGIDRRRPYASYIKPTAPHDVARLVVMTCNLDVDEVLTIAMTPVNVTALADTTTPDAALPLLDAATKEVIFQGPMDTKTLHDDAISQHIEEADLFAAVDAPRRHAGSAKLSFEQLVMVLWHSLEHSHHVGGVGTVGTSPHHHDDHGVLQRAVRDGIRILVDNAGTHQNEQFWLHLETSLRHRIAFDDEEGYEEATSTDADEL